MWIRIRMNMYADPNHEVAQRSNILRAVVPFVKFQPVQFILSVLSIHSAHKGLRHVTELNASCAANCLTAPPPPCLTARCSTPPPRLSWFLAADFSCVLCRNIPS